MKDDLETQNAEVTFPQRPLMVRGDRALLGQLLQNLFENSLKFARPGIEPRISVTAAAKAGFCQISVEDNGIGLDKKIGNTVFDLFARAKPVAEAAGHGIGLAICRRIAVLHGGTIAIDPNYHEGCRMVLSLEESREARS